MHGVNILNTFCMHVQNAPQYYNVAILMKLISYKIDGLTKNEAPLVESWICH